jgi:WD40 repeat protein
VATLEGHPGRWFSCHFHPSGVVLATCSSGEIKFWDLATGALTNTLHGHYAASTHSLSFSPDGSRMAATWREGTIQIRAMLSGDILTTIPASGSEVLSVRFSPDGKTIAATCRSQLIRLYSARGELLAELATGAQTPWTAAFSPDGKKLAVACWGREIQVWDLATRTLDSRLEASKVVVWEVAYMPGRPNILTSCSADGYVQLWDLRQRRNVLTFDPFDGSADSVSFTPDGKTLVAAGGDDGRLCVWDLDYYERHMAGNLHFYIDLLRSELGDAIRTEYLAEWADEVMHRPWPRIGPYAERALDEQTSAADGIGVDPETIAGWGRAAAPASAP